MKLENSIRDFLHDTENTWGKEEDISIYCEPWLSYFLFLFLCRHELSCFPNVVSLNSLLLYNSFHNNLYLCVKMKPVSVSKDIDTLKFIIGYGCSIMSVNIGDGVIWIFSTKEDNFICIYIFYKGFRFNLLHWFTQ